MKNRIRPSDFLTALALPVLFVLLLLEPDAARKSAADALRDCGTVIVPVLLPLAVLSSLLVGSKTLGDAAGRIARPLCRRLRFPDDAGCAVLIGFFGGFPLGIAAVCRLYKAGRLGKDEAERLLALCHNTGPAFVVGYVGMTAFGSAAFGILLYAVEIGSALLIALRMARGAPKPRCLPPVRQDAPAAGLSAAIRDSAAAMLTVTAAVVWFRTVVGVFRAALPVPLHPAVGAALFAVLECMSGIASGAALGGITGMATAAFALGFSGVAVLTEGRVFTAECGLSLRRCITAKIWQGFFAAAAAVLFACREWPAAPREVPVFAVDYRFLTSFELAILTLALLLPALFELFWKRRTAKKRTASPTDEDGTQKLRITS